MNLKRDTESNWHKKKGGVQWEVLDTPTTYLLAQAEAVSWITPTPKGSAEAVLVRTFNNIYF